MSMDYLQACILTTTLGSERKGATGDQRTRGWCNRARGDGEPAETANGERAVATSSGRHQQRAGNHRDGRADRATSQINQSRAIMCVSVLVMGISEEYFSRCHRSMADLEHSGRANETSAP